MRKRLGLCLAVAFALVSAGSMQAKTTVTPISARQASEPPVVASLEPAKTEALWRRIVARRDRHAQAPANCRPLRAVFYAATDYFRLATKLAASASPCAEYYVSVPPLVADKTKPRPSAAPRIRALGPNFHAMAEFHFATWTKWVESTGSSWYTAGVTARDRMAAAGYDVSKGDTWALNELTSAVRRGTGNARANVRELLRGLYDGLGQPARGAVLVIGVGQQTPDVSLYQTNLQSWFGDSAFWADMSRYVSDWSQEVYGDIRNYAVPGVPDETRRDYLNDYLQHEIVLATAGPPTIETARSYLQAAYNPLANAAWERETGYGWTMVTAEQMSAYVSAQVRALRYFSATTGQPQDRWGFAWAPRNGSGMSASDFASKSGLVLDRLGAAVRDSAELVDSADPGSAACGPPGQNLHCVVDLEGARLNEAWKSLRTWTQPALSFATAPQAVPAGTASGPIGLALVTASGLAVTTPTDLAVTVSSSSPTGTFSTSASGPWSSTLALTIPTRTRTAGPFYYLDTHAGSHLLTASAPGVTAGTQALVVTPGAAVSLTVTPPSASVAARSSQELAAAGVDSFGNAFPVSVAWALAPAEAGTLVPATGPTTTFTAGRTLGQATVTASLATETGTLTGTAVLQVTPARLRIGSITYRLRKRVVLVAVSTVDTVTRPVSGAVVSALVLRDGRRHALAHGKTGAAGRVVYRVAAPPKGSCLATTIRSVSAVGFVWNGRTPRNRFCRSASG